eukprot:g5242.t1
MASAAAVLGFCWAAPPCDVRGASSSGVVAGPWSPTPIPHCSVDRPAALLRRWRRPSSSWSRAAAWPASSSTPISTAGEDERRPRARRRLQSRGSSAQRQRQRPFGAMLRRISATRARAGAKATTAAPAAVKELESSREAALASHSGVLLLPPLGWFPAAVAGVLKRRPAESVAATTAAVAADAAAAAAALAAEPVVGAAAGRSVWSLGMSAVSALQWLVRSEAILAGALLVAAPLLLRLWARLEADHHDTLECRSVLQTYLIGGFGWVCAVLAAVAGNPWYAVRLQLAWRVAAARSLWTWSDLGRDLADTPGWLHASVSRWRIAATRFALAGAMARLLVLLVVAIGRGKGAVLALSSPTLDFLPARLLQASRAPLETFGFSSAQLWLGVGMYAWIGYYALCFLPYRMLYDEYQSYQRRVAQIVKDMYNGDDNAVVLSTKLGPQFPKHLTKRMAMMPPGDDREALRLMGIIRQRSCSYTVVKAARRVRKKNGTLAMRMVPLEFGDMRYWGSDLFQRFEQQERHDKKTGWKRPQVPGSGSYKYNRAEYARILRRIRVELGKSDADMENDPALSLSNLMHFDPDAEDSGDFDLVMQQEGQIDVARDNYRMKNSHEMLVKSQPSSTDSQLRDAGVFHGVEEEVGGGVADGSVQGTVLSTDSVSYNSGDKSGRALEEAIRSLSKTPERSTTAAPKMTPADSTIAASRGRDERPRTTRAN